MKNSGNTSFYGLQLNTGNSISWQLDGGSIAGGTTMIAGKWWHACGTITSGGSAVLYINGVSDGTGTSSFGNPSTATAGIGYDPVNNRFWTGYIADVAVWNTALSSGQVTQLFNGTRPINVNSANLQGWWPCDGFSNTTETDRSANANNGTVTGALPILGSPYTWRLG
jgi:hypothetical protein